MTRRCLAAAIALLVGAAPAMAQARKPAGPPSTEFDIGASWIGPVSFGSANGNETQPDGTPLALFSTSSRLEGGVGVEARLSHPIAGRLSAEVSGSWSRATFATTVTADFENAGLLTATNAASAFTAEGAALVRLTRHRKIEPFLRVGAGWFRQVTDDRTLLGDGLIVSAGGGVKYWWKNRGRFIPSGARVDVLAVGRSGGILLGPRRARVAPAVVASLMLRF